MPPEVGRISRDIHFIYFSASAKILENVRVSPSSGPHGMEALGNLHCNNSPVKRDEHCSFCAQLSCTNGLAIDAILSWIVCCFFRLAVGKIENRDGPRLGPFRDRRRDN